MNRLSKFKYVLRVSVKRSGKLVWLKFVFMLLGISGLYSINKNLATSIGVFFLIFISMLVGLVLVISNSNNAYFNKYKKAMDSNKDVPDSLGVTLFFIVYLLIACVVVSVFALKHAKLI